MFHQSRQPRCPQGIIPDERCISLCQASPGSEVIIRGFEGLPVAQKCFLQSYGLLPGRCVRVVAQRPVTIVQIEETELAFESQVAKTILVES